MGTKKLKKRTAKVVFEDEKRGNFDFFTQAHWYCLVLMEHQTEVRRTSGKIITGFGEGRAFSTPLRRISAIFFLPSFLFLSFFLIHSFVHSFFLSRFPFSMLFFSFLLSLTFSSFLSFVRSLFVSFMFVSGVQDCSD